MPTEKSKKRLVRVAVPCPLYKTFDYVLPASLQGNAIHQGMRVRVPFGKQKLIAIVIEEVRHSDIPENKLKLITDVLDEYSSLNEDILTLIFWSAQYYVHPIGEVFQTALPVYIRTNDDATPALTEYWTIDHSQQLTVEATHALLQRAPRQQQLYQLLQANSTEPDTGLDAETLNKLTVNWRPVMKSLLEKKLVTQDIKPAVLLAKNTGVNCIKLNNEQQDTVSAIEQHDKQHAVHVINGITGSGKTEVYLALCKSMLTRGKQILILVPEIGLTPQLTQRFLEQLDTTIVVLHSAMNDRQRYSAWHAAASGAARLVIGTRSSIFTPLPDIGLIIVDEEHDGSYKQQDGFRYNARDLAIVRARNNNIPVVLGSATISLETLNNINERRYQPHYLKQRANQKPLPRIELINLCNQKLQEGMAETLLSTIRKHLDQQGQVLIFINRRGYAPLLMCHDCGWTTSCLRCDAHMTYHKQRHLLQCHHCGSQRRAPESCESCGSSNILAIGAGTERIEQYLQQAFPATRVSRIDRDTTRNKGSLQEKLEQARSGESGILVGTQMLAKGHDFPNISLVCILDSDQALFSADFRAAEHLAQLITQVAGRAGRAEKPGAVLIQTHHPEHPFLQMLIHKGYLAFADAALSERLTAGLPPARHLALIRCESVDTKAAQIFLNDAVTYAKQLSTANIEIFGPLPAPMERRAGRYRYQLMIQSPHRKPLHQLLSQCAPYLQQMPSARKVRWSLDVDPYDTF